MGGKVKLNLGKLGIGKSLVKSALASAQSLAVIKSQSKFGRNSSLKAPGKVPGIATSAAESTAIQN